MAKEQEKVDSTWDPELSELGTLNAPAHGGRTNYCNVFSQTTPKGEHPPRTRLVIKCNKGAHRGETLTIESTSEGLLINNNRFLSDLGPDGELLLTFSARVAKNGMIDGWNSGQLAGYRQGYNEGVEAEKARAKEAAQQRAEASKQAYLDAAEEAKNRGITVEDVFDERIKEAIKEGKVPGLPKSVRSDEGQDAGTAEKPVVGDHSAFALRSKSEGPAAGRT